MPKIEGTRSLHGFIRKRFACTPGGCGAEQGNPCTALADFRNPGAASNRQLTYVHAPRWHAFRTWLAEQGLNEDDGKVCGSCVDFKPWSAFPEHKGRKDGHTAYCSACNARYAAEYQDRVVDAMFSAYGGKCVCCGISRRTFLQIDHVDGNGAAHRKETRRTGGFPLAHWLRANGWPEGFQILCANCHAEKTKRGRCTCSDGSK